MAANLFEQLLGSSLESASGPVATGEALRGRGAVALYFSAHWCPPCKSFTPKLAEWYTGGLREKGLEVVFMSADNDEEQFAAYFKEMPWLALPYKSRQLHEGLAKKFRITGIPGLIILDGTTGKVITREGRMAIGQDPTGERFPWRPKLPSEMLANGRFLTGDGRTLTLAEASKGKRAVALYFSAHWCGPCRGFTPQLVQRYTSALRDKGLEIIFVSWDSDEEAFRGYFQEMPWLALEYSERALSQELGATLGVRGIPELVVLDEDLQVATTRGRTAVDADPTGEDLPWRRKPVQDLAHAPEPGLSDAPTVIVFCETQDRDKQKALEEALRPVAQKYLDKQKADEEEFPEFGFVLCKSSGGICGKVRGMLRLPPMPPAAHEHPLVKEENMHGWGCDGCGCDSTETFERWRCSQGCDFDYCGSCHERAGLAVEPMPAVLALMDMPHGNVFYLATPDAEITTEAVDRFLADYTAGRLEKKMLSD